jgi:hypothetical protein
MTTFKAKDIAAVEAQLEEIGAKAASFPGQVCSQVIWNEDGAGVVVAIYESADAAAEGAKNAAAIWGGLMPLLEGAPESTEFTKAYIMK